MAFNVCCDLIGYMANVKISFSSVDETLKYSRELRLSQDVTGLRWDSTRQKQRRRGCILLQQRLTRPDVVDEIAVSRKALYRVVHRGLEDIAKAPGAESSDGLAPGAKRPWNRNRARS